MNIDKVQQKGYASVNGLNLYYEIYGSGESANSASRRLHDR